jgi:hypothetical protein
VKILLDSLDFAADDVSNGMPLRDWEHSDMSGHIGKTIQKIKKLAKLAAKVEYQAMRFAVERALAFMEAHKNARKILKCEFLNSDTSDLSQAEKLVMKESKIQCEKAVALIRTFPERDVEMIVSHKFCTILLTGNAQHVEGLAEARVLKGVEAEEFLEEIQEQLNSIEHCSMKQHAGELPLATKSQLNKDLQVVREEGEGEGEEDEEGDILTQTSRDSLLEDDDDDDTDDGPVVPQRGNLSRRTSVAMIR